MDILISVRHGQYSGKDLTEYGQEQARILALEMIREHIKVRKTIVFHSPLPRAIQTAVIISELIGCDAKMLPVLVEDEFFNAVEIMRELVEEVGEEVQCVITVGHFTAVPGLVYYFLPSKPKESFLINYIPEMGEGLVLDLNTGQISSI